MREDIGPNDLAQPGREDVVRCKPRARGPESRLEIRTGMVGFEKYAPAPGVGIDQLGPNLRRRHVSKHPPEEQDRYQQSDGSLCPVPHESLPWDRAATTSCFISATALSIPTNTDRLTTECPMFSSSQSSMAATGVTFP